MCTKELVSDQPQNVVILDDNPDLLDFYEEIFLEHRRINSNCFVDTSYNFFKYINQNHTDLFIIDIVLSAGKNGIKISEEIIKRGKGSVFLFTSGYNYNKESLKHLKGKCVYDFMSKPFNKEEFLITVHTLLNISNSYKESCKNYLYNVDEIRTEYFDMIMEQRRKLEKIPGANVFS